MSVKAPHGMERSCIRRVGVLLMVYLLYVPRIDRWRALELGGEWSTYSGREQWPTWRESGHACILSHMTQRALIAHFDPNFRLSPKSRDFMRLVPRALAITNLRPNLHRNQTPCLAHCLSRPLSRLQSQPSCVLNTVSRIRCLADLADHSDYNSCDHIG